MSVHVSSAVWKLRTGDPAKKAVLLKLADNANDDGECWPSITTISNETEYSRSTVCRKLSELEDDKIIKRIRRGYSSTKYQLNMDKIRHPNKGVVPP